HRVRRRRGGEALVQFAGIPEGAANPAGQFEGPRLYRRRRLGRRISHKLPPWISKASALAAANEAAMLFRSIVEASSRKKPVKPNRPINSPRNTRSAAAAPLSRWAKAASTAPNSGYVARSPLRRAPNTGAHSVS